MGCVCTENTNDQYSIEDILDVGVYENDKNNINSKLKLSEYVKKVFFLINKIRTDPSKFVDVVVGSQKFIKEIGERKIFDHKLKVALNEGQKMFEDCAEYLRNLSPMPELIFNDEIVLECPKEPNNIKDINFFKQKVTEKNETQKLEAYFKDSIQEPDISVLLMIVDDSPKNPRKKRLAVLNPNYKFIGISSSDIDDISTNDENKIQNNNGNNNENGTPTPNKKPFCAYFAFK